jgi:hypothetical protein
MIARSEKEWERQAERVHEYADDRRAGTVPQKKEAMEDQSRGDEQDAVRQPAKLGIKTRSARHARDDKCVQLEAGFHISMLLRTTLIDLGRTD